MSTALAVRQYGRCAKGAGGGHPKPVSTAYVCAEHRGTPGPLGFCAVCGTRLDGAYDYVCGAHLVHRNHGGNR